MSEETRLTLDRNGVHVWFVRTDEASLPDRLSGYHELLSDEERDRHARFVFERDRNLFLVSHALVRITLSRYADVPPASWRFESNAHGRPEVSVPARHGRLRFNLSHTHGLAAVAVTRDRDVGVDVEALHRRPSTNDVAGRYFSPAEVEQLRGIPAGQRHEAFLRFWTLKESYIKARGMGLTLPLRHFTFHLRDDRQPEIAFGPELEDDPALWQFAECRPTPQHLLAVAVRRSNDCDVDIQVRRTVPPV